MVIVNNVVLNIAFELGHGGKPKHDTIFAVFFYWYLIRLDVCGNGTCQFY